MGSLSIFSNPSGKQTLGQATVQTVLPKENSQKTSFVTLPWPQHLGPLLERLMNDHASREDREFGREGPRVFSRTTTHRA